MREHILVGSLVLVLAVVFVPAASAEARYFETTVLTDAADDYAANGALDIVALHVAEKYSIASGTGRDTFQVRVELRNLQDFENYVGQTKLEVTLGYKVNGVDATHTATVSQVCYVPPPQTRPMCESMTVDPAPSFASPGTGVTFVLDSATLGLLPGSVVSDLYAATATLHQDQRAYHDVAPADNRNQPHGFMLEPAERGGSYTIEGGYPFLAQEALAPTERFIVAGGEQTFPVRYTIHGDQAGLDRVALLYAMPEGWAVEANLGSDFVVSQPGEVVDVDFRVRAPTTAAIGDTADIVIDAVLVQAGGHVERPLHLVVSGPRVEIPGYSFALVQPAQVEAAGDPPLKVRVLYLDQPLVRHRVAADFRVDGAREATVTAVEEGDGVYALPFAFPRGGTWDVDVYVSELEPSPTHTFTVEVDGAAQAPAPGWSFALLLVGLAWTVRRRLGA